MLVRRFAFLFILLLTALPGNGAESNDTLELPRKADIDGQRCQVLTDRYDITASNIDDALLAGGRLEHLFHAWQLLSAEHFEKPANEPEQRRRHRVIIFRDQQEYNRELLPVEPSIEKTNGFYSAQEKTVYFYSTEAKLLFHEGTHQILAEHFFHERIPAFRNNFWVAEGIAAFMETFQIEEKSYKAGDILADKLLAAKIYQFERNYDMPIEKLTAMSAADVQASTEIRRIYSQSATLVHWLMFAEEGRYRKHLFELLRQTYLDTAKPETLSKLTGLSYEELDKKYVEFLKTIPD